MSWSGSKVRSRTPLSADRNPYLHVKKEVTKIQRCSRASLCRCTRGEGICTRGEGILARMAQTEQEGDLVLKLSSKSATGYAVSYTHLTLPTILLV